MTGLTPIWQLFVIAFLPSSFTFGVELVMSATL